MDNKRLKKAFPSEQIIYFAIAKYSCLDALNIGLTALGIETTSELLQAKDLLREYGTLFYKSVLSSKIS